MKAFEHETFQPCYPELFNYNLLDSPKVEAVAIRLQEAIGTDSLTRDRVLTPGLRVALRELAAVSDLL